MFDIGFWEITLIFVVGLLILGPQRMPKVARTAGLFLGRARAAMRKLQLEVQRELMIEETQAAVDAARKAFDQPVMPDATQTAPDEPVAPRSEPAPGEPPQAPDIEPVERNDNRTS